MSGLFGVGLSRYWIVKHLALLLKGLTLSSKMKLAPPQSLKHEALSDDLIDGYVDCGF